MNLRHLLLLSAALGLAGCGSEDPPSPWEIIHGSASLELSAAVHPDTRALIVEYHGRTGTLSIADDSTTSGWVHVAAGDSISLDGVVTRDGNDLIVTFDSVVPAEYTVITNGDFPDVYALLSTAVINSDITGDAVPDPHRTYWQFSR